MEHYKIAPRPFRPRPICFECGGRATSVFTNVARDGYGSTVIAHSCEQHHSEVHTIVKEKLKEELNNE